MDVIGVGAGDWRRVFIIGLYTVCIDTYRTYTQRSQVRCGICIKTGKVIGVGNCAGSEERYFFILIESHCPRVPVCKGRVIVHCYESSPHSERSEPYAEREDVVNPAGFSKAKRRKQQEHQRHYIDYS